MEGAALFFETLIAHCIRVHDGDTLTVDIPNLPAVFGKGIQVRLRGWDAPEIHDLRPEIKALAEQAREMLAKAALGQTVTLHNVRRDKYFRLDADIFVAEVDVTPPLLQAGLVRAYTGKGPKPW